MNRLATTTSRSYRPVILPFRGSNSSTPQRLRLPQPRLFSILTLHPRSRSTSTSQFSTSTSSHTTPTTQFTPKPAQQSPASPSAASTEPYPYSVYLIPTTNTNEYAISFLPEPDLASKPTESQRSCIIGWTRLNSLPSPDTNTSTTAARELFLDPKTFIQNETFETFLHTVIGKSIINDSTTQILANEQKTGWLNIPDTRCFVPWGRIPEVEDILGSVQLSEDAPGTMVPGSYQRNTMHRLVSLNGLFRLPEIVQKELVEALKAL
jgi:hypothetical protein